MSKKWLQLHLSTIISLALVSGVMIGVNLDSNWEREVYIWEDDLGATMHSNIIRNRKGFPFVWYVSRNGTEGEATPELNERNFQSFMQGFGRFDTEFPIPELARWELAGNIGLGLIVLLSIAVVLEWRIRRKERAAQRP